MEQLNGKASSSRRTQSEVLELLSEYDKNPGMTVKAFCKIHQISEGSFYSARKRYRNGGGAVQKKPGFIAIPSPRFSEDSLFAEVNAIRLYQPVPADYLKALAL